jgi:uncharacterized protein YaaQ
MNLDKLVMAVIQDEDAFHLMDMLNTKGFSITKLSSTGGFLRSGNTTFICGVTDERLPEFVDVIERKCRSRKQIASVNAMDESEFYAPKPVEITVGGANIFVLNIDRFHRV